MTQLVIGKQRGGWPRGWRVAFDKQIIPTPENLLLMTLTKQIQRGKIDVFCYEKNIIFVFITYKIKKVKLGGRHNVNRLK